MRLLRERSTVLPSVRRLIVKVMVGVALGSPVLSSSWVRAAPPQAGPDVEAERKALHERVERVRAALRAEAGAVIEPEARSRFAQWYNWGDWPNGWNNYWNNWPNGWWNG